MSNKTQQPDISLTMGSDFWPESPCLALMRVNSGISDIEETATSASVSAPPAAPPSPPSVTPPLETSARPQRAAKRRAIENIRSIQEWEQCNEGSELFRSVARRFNEEMNNEILTREEREQVEQEDALENFEAEETVNEETRTETSEEESPTASLRDFIVSDDEEMPDDESYHTCSEVDSENDSLEETASEHENEDSDNEEEETLPF